MKPFYYLVASIIHTSVQCSKVALLVVATGKYIAFIPPLIESAEKFFLPDEEVHFFVFTDTKPHLHKTKLKTNPKVTLLPQPHMPWPFSSMLRYKSYLDHKNHYSSYDYIFACDADALFAGPIDKRILASCVGVTHCSVTRPRIPEINAARYDEYHFDSNHWTLAKDEYTYEKNPLSRAYIDEGTYYFHANFFGGGAQKFFDIVSYCYEGMIADFNNHIIALWHDESHLNRYFKDNPPALILPPLFAYQWWADFHTQLRASFQPKICDVRKYVNVIRK